jgi:hypothetical protein
MTFKGTYKLAYVLDKEQKELTVVVELLLRDGMGQPFQNLYVGNATVNGQPYEDERLESCVDAKLMAERIGLEHKEKLIAKIKKEGKRIKIKKEEIK